MKGQISSKPDEFIEKTLGVSIKMDLIFQD